MKRFFAVCTTLLLIVMTLIPAFAVGEDKDYSHLKGTKVTVYNWGEYISDGAEGSLDVNKEFTAKYGIDVIYSTFDSNENMYNKLKSGGANYDVVIPSDYMIERMIKEDMLEKIDYSNIPNYENILDEYKGLYFDPDDKYTVPYTVGMVGLIYNTTMVKDAPESWSIMWDEKYSNQILTFSNPRDAFAIAQFLEGIDINSENAQEWNKAFEKLKEQKPLIQSYVMDEIFNKMEGGEAAIAPYYAGDFLSMKEVNGDLAFVYPKEGTNIFVDSMCIPNGAQNKEAAELYINFMLSEEIAVANAEYICYASPNRAVVESDEYSLKDEPILYPSADEKPNTEYFHNLSPETLSTMTSLWDDLKIEGNSNTGIYIGIAVFVVVAAVVIIVTTVQKKKRNSMY